MASSASVPSRALLEAFSPVRRYYPCHCRNSLRAKHRNANHTRRGISTATTQQSEMEVDRDERPRWSRTPPGMAAPYPAKARSPNWRPFECNSDPQKLDNMYTNFLGPNGPKLLSEETKWLAVTHKSFDHGRRGFNDRLAFFGKRIVELQLSLGLLSSLDASKYLPIRSGDPHGREPFVHPATSNIEALSGNAKSYFMHHKQISKLASQHSIPGVVRWLPKNPNDLYASGCDMVYAQAVFAIIGALAMEQGGAVANRIARERVIQLQGIAKGIEGIPEGQELS